MIKRKLPILILVIGLIIFYSLDITHYVSMENFSKHYKTKEILSDNHIEKLIKTRNFQSSLFLSRQLEFAIFDFKIHQKLYTNKEFHEQIINMNQKQ